MKTFENYDVQEMNMEEIKEVEGGHMVGYSKWYNQQKSDDFWDLITWLLT